MDQPVSNAPTSNKKKNYTVLFLILISVIAVLLLVICCLAFFVAQSKMPTTDNSIQTNNTTKEIPSEQSPVSVPVSSPTESKLTPLTQDFKGSYISASLPTGWSIKEYNDINGMYGYDNSPGSPTFTGLTGFDVINENNVAVFSVKGVDGVGGGGGCQTVAKFNDTSSNYIQGVVNDTSNLGTGSTQVIDLTNSNYTEINFMGLVMRRVGNVLYRNTYAYSNEFTPACGIDFKFTQLPGISFSSGSYTANVYSYEINQSITDEPTLEKLDAVLNNLSGI